MARISAKANWVVAVAISMATAGFAAKRFMDPHDPPSIPVPSGEQFGGEWIGKKLTPFRLRGIGGTHVDSSNNLGKRPVVIVFHGGQESPFSMNQVVQLGAAKEIKAAKAAVYVISIDDPADIARPVKRQWVGRGLPEDRSDFIFAGDDYGSFSRTYVGEAAHPNPSVPASLTRATFVVGKGRRILYAHINATPKLNPPDKEVFAALQKARAEFDSGR